MSPKSSYLSYYCDEPLLVGRRYQGIVQVSRKIADLVGVKPGKQSYYIHFRGLGA